MQKTDDPEQQSLDDAPPPRPVDELRVLHRTTATLAAVVIGPKGLAIDVKLDNVPYSGLAALADNAIAFEKTMLEKGFKVPQRATVTPSVPPPTSASAPAAAAAPAHSGPVELPGENGGPPRCSIHGAMKWLEGTSKSTGKDFAFYACTQRDCRPAKAKA